MIDFKKVTSNLAYLIGGIALGIVACAWNMLIGMTIIIIGTIIVEALCAYWKRFWIPTFSNIAFGTLGGSISLLIIEYCKIVFHILN